MKPPSLAKAILALLLCQVLTVTQVFAIAGGPPIGTGFGGGGTTNLNLTGTYSGVLQGLTQTTPNTANNTPPPIPGDPTPPATTTPTTSASTAIGLFDLGVTQTTGLATGTFLLFADGRVFSGTITGAVNPGTGTLQGILQASFAFTVSSVAADGTVTALPVTASAFGRLDSAISGATSTSTTTPSTTGGTSTAPAAATTLVTLSGTASLSISFGEVDANTLQPVVDQVLTFSVNGFRNSTTVALTPLAVAATGG